MDDLSRLAAKRDNLRLRARILRTLRAFFEAEGFLEVTTPLLSRSILPEENVDGIEVEGGYLLPSPEIHMKRLLAAGFERIFQVSPCFRKGELGAHHLPEFTMVEWYRAGAGYGALAEDCEALLPAIARQALGSTTLTYGGRSIDLTPPWPRFTTREAFQAHAGWDPLSVRDPDRFEEDLTEKVVPSLEAGKPVFLVDFPAYEASLARRRSDDPRVAERIELFAGGLELANGFSELIDPEEQQRRFVEANRKREARGASPYPIPPGFLAFLPAMPASAGIALGLDRLVMLLADAVHIEEVICIGPAES